VNILLLRRLVLAFVVLILTVLLSGCFFPGGGYYDGEDIGPGYYEPYGVVYGGWGPDYHVAPFRGGEHQRPTSGGGHTPTRAYRSAPASHSMPSIPSKSRSGDPSKSRSGGSRSR
jgi:hypothetical protein